VVLGKHMDSADGSTVLIGEAKVLQELRERKVDWDIDGIRAVWGIACMVGKVVRTQG
jgi:hypothetical protein